MSAQRATPARPGRVLIVEDDRLVALDIEVMLREFGFWPCATAGSADEALSLAREHTPDLVLMDIRLQGEPDGICAAQRLREDLGLGVVYLTANSELATVERAKATQPYGYLLKPIRPLDLRCCLELALHRARLERDAAAGKPARSLRDATGDRAKLERLSGRELEVLALIARGYTSKDIAQTLQIGKPTVDTYRSRLMEKLGARSRTELVGIANRAGLLQSGPASNYPAKEPRKGLDHLR